MRQILFGSLAALAFTLLLSAPAKADYFLELVSVAPNLFQIEIWSNDAFGEFDSPLDNIATEVAFSSFTGDFNDASSITNVEVTPLMLGNSSYVAAPANPPPDQELDNPAVFGVFSFPLLGDPEDLPPTANSAQNALPVMQVSFVSSGVGTFDAVILGPTPLGTVVNDNTIPVQVGSSITVSAVPEASSFILVGLVGGLGYGCVWLRRRRGKTEQ